VRVWIVRRLIRARQVAPSMSLPDQGIYARGQTPESRGLDSQAAPLFPVPPQALSAPNANLAKHLRPLPEPFDRQHRAPRLLAQNVGEDLPGQRGAGGEVGVEAGERARWV
jgi:hypothetical protein